MTVQFKKCESCHQLRTDINQFVHDTNTDDWICTLCGGIVRRWIYTERRHSFAHTSPVVENGYVPPPTGQVRKLYKNGINMTNRFFPEEVRENRMIAELKSIGEQLEYSEKIINRGILQIKKFAQLRQIRPIQHTLIAILVVSKRSYNEYVNLKSVASQMNCRDLGKTVISVCSTLGLSQRSSPVSNIPKLVQLLGFNYKYVNHVKKLYLSSRRKNGSIGSDTLLALVLLRFYMANKQKSKVPSKNITLDFIARITHTSKSSLRGYIDCSGGKCTLFNKNIKSNFI